MKGTDDKAPIPAPPTGIRRRLAKTLFINLSFMLGLGLFESARGPTLLDLAEVYHIDLETLSFMFLTTSVGSLIGSFCTGWFMDKYPGLQAFFLFATTFLLGLSTLVLPFLRHVYLFFALTFVLGLSSGAVDTAGNLYCLNTWRGLDGGPYMHSIHFSFSAGSFLAPLLATPFLSDLEDNTPSRITLFYPLIGGIAMLVSTGFLLFVREEWIEHQQSTNNTHVERDGAESGGPTPKVAKQQSLTKAKLSLVVLVGVFVFLYAGAEYSLANFLTTFAVECQLQLSKTQGAELTAIYWGAFAVMRLAAIFAAIRLDPKHVMGFSFICSLVGGVALSIWAEHSFLALQIGTGILGVGMASVYATGILWLEGYVLITGRLGCLFPIAASIGPDTYPILVGHFIEDWPMLLMHLMLATMVGCILLFMLAACIGRRVQSENQLEIEKEGAEEADEKIEMKPLEVTN
ncbi:sodium-dependent glucose transporter 1-like [Tigriopus californicus]|uniref:sodium-dependent glucose transporter 1-like n=1 Tax=Tigriopus californicus TaxID=6832 RepID=UPI0027DA23D0|nr:sodium-dependent glucose transporter 1-like [Tigriopus californicus]XP_059099099.1 sodium-dependent glucose transporter 1-like [Tigriopus californicus]XP_059099100.1 sodium-dependent glucose transporter 1-like [Tigriopus californicus]